MQETVPGLFMGSAGDGPPDCQSGVYKKTGFCYHNSIVTVLDFYKDRFGMQKKGGELYANDRKEKKDHGCCGRLFCVVFCSFSQCETGKQQIRGRESCRFLHLAECALFCDGAGECGRTLRSPDTDAPAVSRNETPCGGAGIRNGDSYAGTFVRALFSPEASFCLYDRRTGGGLHFPEGGGDPLYTQAGRTEG